MSSAVHIPLKKWFWGSGHPPHPSPSVLTLHTYYIKCFDPQHIQIPPWTPPISIPLTFPAPKKKTLSHSSRPSPDTQTLLQSGRSSSWACIVTSRLWTPRICVSLYCLHGHLIQHRNASLWVVMAVLLYMTAMARVKNITLYTENGADVKWGTTCFDVVLLCPFCS